MIEPRTTSEPQQLAPHDHITQQRSFHRPSLVPVDYSGGEEAALSLRDFWNILRRRRAIALNTFLLVVVLGIVLTLITTPRFSSTARVLVEGKTQMLSISDTKDPLGNLFVPTTGHDVATQVEILRSPVVLNQVHETTRIPPGSVSVEVRAVPDTDLIDLTATSTSKQYAESFAKAMPEVYLRKVKGERISELKAALSFARRRMEEQRQRVQKAEAAVADFQEQKGAIRPGQGAQLMTEVGNAQAAVSQAQADLSVARSKLAALENARSGVSSSLQTPITTSNPEIANLKSQIAQLQDQRAKLLFRFKPGEDEVREVDLQIQQLERRLAQTPATITNTSRGPNPEAASLESQITAAKVAVREAEAALSAAEARAGQVAPELEKLTPLERTAARLQRDVQVAQQGLDSLAQSVQDLTLREQAAEAKNNPVSVIATASPAQQISPRIARNIVMSLVLGALLACGMALLQHSLDDHVNDEEEARSLLDIPVLGMLPLVVSDDSEEKTPFDAESSGRPALILSRAEPRLMESFRMLRSNVYFSLVNSPSRTILVTSTMPGEGKTTTAANLATILALDGRRVILVDADMRRPSLDAFFSLPRQPGLSNILAGQSSWRDAVQETKVPGLRLITSGALPPNPAELLGSPTLDELISDLQQDADMVIFDTPPCPATADTPVLSSKVDGVIYVMHLGKVRKAGLQHAFDLLHQANAHLLGVVFNKFETSARQGYGYYYGYGYGYGQDKDESAAVGRRSRKGGAESAMPLDDGLDEPGAEHSEVAASGEEK